jgi:hypothetical protein
MASMGKNRTPGILNSFNFFVSIFFFVGARASGLCKGPEWVGPLFSFISFIANYAMLV